ncbi:DUF2218 domain-containing protein [Phaeobacter inhibens]|uniref:DUF2218 domain-containing protein n=1 Tax=Phaeobacter inhibens TaxID=221822 RepID=UPI0021A2780F|nr:DUF2218 domain-containing protein [Phaeobacter inhibens]UWR47376.1 DUF2218 domain-containing protein [Phaeobacter inhibens]UWR70792.1 DUF2218 domain-containing protein [Phaeobacter inhibens]UWR98399.1 DUF2218 domain-containing protein [Phaeobacter inhibens]
MLTDTGHFDTPNASKYLQQICKHFAHKVAVTHDDTKGTVALGMGPATLTAEDQHLRAEVTAPTAEELDHARQIIDNHLKRFAFREEFEAMTWASATAPA